VTRREVFLAEMAGVVPWRRLEALIEPHYPKVGNGRKPYPLDVMLRVHFLQHWYGYSDPGLKEALHDTPALRRFAGLDAGESRMPDETTILGVLTRKALRHQIKVRARAPASAMGSPSPATSAG